MATDELPRKLVISPSLFKMRGLKAA